jgi:hypothetical protein
MQHGRLQAYGRGGEPTSLGVAILHFAMPRAGKFWSQFPACGTAGDCGPANNGSLYLRRRGGGDDVE